MSTPQGLPSRTNDCSVRRADSSHIDRRAVFRRQALVSTGRPKKGEPNTKARERLWNDVSLCQEGMRFERLDVRLGLDCCEVLLRAFGPAVAAGRRERWSAKLPSFALFALGTTATELGRLVASRERASAT